jgi:hypothetical protein
MSKQPDQLSPDVRQFTGSVSVRASKYSWLAMKDEIFQAASNTFKTVAGRRRKWNLR